MPNNKSNLDSIKTFSKFVFLPRGPSIIVIIGAVLCIFFFLSQIRNVAQQYSAYNNCSLEQNFYDMTTVIVSFFIGVISVIGLVYFSMLLKNLYSQYLEENVQ